MRTSYSRVSPFSVSRKLIVLWFAFLFCAGFSNSVLAVDASPERFDSFFTYSNLPTPGPDALSGALTYDYPITIPPGRNSLQPDLKLRYNNQDLTQNSVYGTGWTDNIPYIQRLNKKGSDKLYSTSTSSYFHSSIAGELVATSTEWRAKVDNGAFLTFATSSDTWIVKDKQGTTYTFGNATSTRQDDPGDSIKIFKWMLAKTEDANGNSITYEYFKDEGQIYPSAIKYTHSATSTDGIFRIDFLRESRNDVATTTSEGFFVRTNYRIDEIQVKINGSLTRKYEIAYATGDNGDRSLINTITETGYDESGTPTALPATDFDFQSQTHSWTQNTGWTIPSGVYFTDSSSNDLGVRLADVNGDGLVDLIKAPNGTNATYLNTSMGWTASSTWDLPNALDFVDSNYYDQGVRFADVNGDGRADVVMSNSTATSTRAVYINNGAGWTLSETWVFPEWWLLYFADKTSGRDNGLRLFDANGDGLPDLVFARDDGVGGIRKMFLNNGTDGWEEDTSWTFVTFTGTFFGHASINSDYGFRFADFNGDGLADLLRGSDVGKKVYMNNGRGWTEQDHSSWNLPLTFANSAKDSGVRLSDANGDNLPDLVYLDPNGSLKKVYLNDGHGWTNESGWTMPNITFSSTDGYDLGARLVDINGDGLDDFVRLYSSGNIQGVYLSDQKHVDAVTRVTYPQGGKKEIQYKPSAQYTDTSGNLLNADLPFTLQTVATTTQSDGWGFDEAKTYTYAKGKFYFNDSLDRKYSGFGQVTETNGDNATTTTFYHGGTQNESNKGQYQDHIAKAGKPYRVEMRGGSGGLYSLQINKWDRADLGNDASFVKLAQSVMFTYDGNASHNDKAGSFTYNDSNGNTTQKIEWGEVTGSDDGSFTDSGTDKFTADLSYATNASNTIYKLSQETVTDQSANKVRETRNYYDTLSLGLLNKGNLTKEERWKTSSTYIDVEKIYDSYGLVIQEKDPRDKVTSHVYDSFKLYVATSTNPVLHTTESHYDYSLGKPKKTVDANNLIFQIVFDGLDRITEEKQPDMTATSTLVTKTTYTYTNQTVGLKTQRTDYLNSATSTDTFTYTDGLNRVIQTRKEAEDSNTYSVTDAVYNTIGQLGKESLPYSSTGSSHTASTTTSTLYNVFSYDPLLRVTSVANAVGTTTNTYEDWKTTVTDPRGKQKHLYKDAHDNLWKVEEVSATSTYTTLYEYNGNKNLTKITDALSNIRNFTYDGLGRRLTAQDLHASGDGAYGTWTYTYADAGNLTQTVDPKSQTIDYTYDDINRALTENYTGQGGTEFTYAYDTCANGKPRLCSVTSASATTTLAYNPLGQVKQEVKTVSGTSYQTDYTHDRQGSVLTVTNPDGSQVRYTYNTAGQLEMIERKEANDSSFASVVTDFNYGPHGKVTYRENADGTATNNTYDATELHRLENRTTTFGVGGDELSGLGLDLGMFDVSGSSPENTAPLAVVEDASLPSLAALPVQKGWNYISAPISQTEYQVEFHDKWIHYKTPTGWKNINTDFVAAANGFEMKAAPFEVTAPVTSTGIAVMHNNNRWDVFKGTEISEAPLDLSIQALNVNDVPGKLVRGDLMAPTGLQKNVSYVLYEGAYSQGDLIYYVDFGKAPRLEKLVRFNAEPAVKSYAFKISYSNNVEIRQEVEGAKALWDESAALKAPHNKGLHISKENSDIRGIGFKEFQVWDSNPALRSIAPIEVDITPLGDNAYTLTKTIPDSFFTPATVYPAYTDTTSTFYPDPDTESTSVDGMVRYDPSPSGDTWANARNNSGTSANDTDPSLSVRLRGATTSNQWRTMDRTIAGFDTSSIPDTDTISSATLSAYGQFKNNTSSYGGLSVVVDHTVPASATALVAGDYGITDWDNTMQSNTDITFASWSTAGYNDFALNATGLGNISKTGVSWFGWRTDADLDNSEPTWENNVESDAGFYSADETGTSKDPKLTVTYVPTNQAPTAPTSLQTEGQANPVEVTDSTPEFSAIYNDPNAGDLAIYYRIQVATSTAFTSLSWDSGKTSMASTTESTRSPDISYAGSAMASSTTYYVRMKFWDDDDAEGAWSTATSTFSLNSAPSEPSNMFTESQTNPTGVTDATPEFSAIYNDPDTTDLATHYRLQVATSTAFANIYWGTQKTTLTATTTQGTRSPDISYSGSALTSNTTYYWRLKFWDDASTEGSWSTATSSFAVTIPGTGLQNLTYAYDSSGNITRIVDASATNSAKTIDYTYDDLNRLTTASTTNAVAGSNYSYAYTYDAIGNIASSTESGAYTYAGTNYANPHAATTLGSTTYAYDNNGNLTSKGAWTYVWDYQNRMTSAGNGTATSTYAYDYTGQRVSQTAGDITTYYPTKYYNATTATSTKHIFTPSGELIATVEGNSTATTTQYIHTDHLGGSAVVTNSDGDQIELTDYYPYGDVRLNEGAFNEQRKYIGEQYDDDTSLSYLNARYYSGSRGQFMSQDSTHLAIGDANKVKQITKLDQQQYLADPQILNSYSYARDNPIISKDPLGTCPLCGLALMGAGGGIVGQFAYDVYSSIQAGGLQNAFSNFSSGETYLTRAIQGAFLGATGGAVSALTGTGIFGQAAIIGGASGIVGVGGDAYLGQPVTVQSVATDTFIGGLTFGAGALVPNIPGRLPNLGTKAFFTGEHTLQSAKKLGVDAISSYLGSLFGNASFKGNAQTNTNLQSGYYHEQGQFLQRTLDAKK